MKRAAWNVQVPRRRVEADGRAVVVVTFVDGTALQATLTVEVTADRQVSMLLVNEPGVTPMGIDSAWSRES